jgi:hypothetical protein
MALSYTGTNSDSQDQAVKVGNPVVYNIPTPASYAAGNQSYTTSDILGSLIIHDGTGNANATLPNAAALASAIPGCRTGDAIECLIINGANASGAITLVASTGVSFDTNQAAGSRIIAFASSKYIVCRFTSTAPGSQAYTVYS